ncbi:hypothetical protein Celly_2617 [Cellulophaga lytica DSM 7489]|uniref:Pectate lyase superfamily protein domain-containing protein n=1 Tax=Cellulophaga lytica (strain ATCC 23178 / DSM 7489 / JCM 8516 / NBRC 14961 / NCIMB 1423 / VKM B-1433 / Cy l20) TaxID=867900 RepID=F0R9T9_CELLC|nr:hypothetical protein [Cellulophaga lytica]ADY30434.1 hypothetical protein Celly_2617 [Cellulophaga lytica DSM 7489]WQG78634.1 hypothetical protein SR888_06790 [Cellulophaga lytica]
MQLTKFTSKFMLFLIFICLMSCSQDSDLLADLILEEKEEIIEPSDPVTGSDEDPYKDKDFSNPNKIVGSYYPTSQEDITNADNANKKAIITNSFTCNNCTFAANQTIEPAGGVITGENINLNNAFIENTYKQAFSSSTTFTGIYDKSRLSIEVFGAISGDGVDDSAAIDAAINNIEVATASPNGLYVKNKPSTYKREGNFDWNLNGAKIETTSNSDFRINTFDVDYIFTFYNLSPRIYNGEFDGTDTYGRLIWLRGQQSFYFADLNVHNYHSTSNARGIAFRVNMYPQSYGFNKGEFYRNTINNISSASDGIANNVNGLSKGILLGLYEDGAADVFLEDNIITNIIGDDAECLYIAPHGSATMDNNVNFYLTNETYKYAKRRQAKITVSNVHIRDSYFEAPGVAQDFNGQAAVILGVFSTKKGQTNKNFELINSDLVSNNIPTMGAIAVTELEDAKIIGNRITFSDISNYPGLTLGSGTTGYYGVLINNTIKENEFTNCGVEIARIFDPQNGPVVIDESTFNYNWGGNNPGNYVGVLRYSSSSNATVTGAVTLKNSAVNYSAGKVFNLFSGVVVSIVSSVENLTIDNVTVNYKGLSGVGQAFGYIGSKNSSNFGNTNAITNCTINGALATGAIKVTGSNKTVKISNSKDSAGLPITVF